MVKNIKENIKKVKNVEKEYTIGVMVIIKKDNILMIKFMVEHFIITQMVELKKENIKMEKEYKLYQKPLEMC